MSVQHSTSQSPQLQRLQQTLAELQQQRVLLAAEIVKDVPKGKLDVYDQPAMYKLCRAESQDGANRTALFLETEASGEEVKYFEIGKTPDKMSVDGKKEEDPLKVTIYKPDSKVQLGLVNIKNIPRLEAICQTRYLRCRRMRYNSTQSDLAQPPPMNELIDAQWIKEALSQLYEQNILEMPSTTKRSQDALKLQGALKLSHQTLRQHMDALRCYNETKDVANTLIGMIAEKRQERIIETMKSFDVDATD